MVDRVGMDRLHQRDVVDDARGVREQLAVDPAAALAALLELEFRRRDGKPGLAACHGGWRGLSQGIVARTVQQMLFEKKPDDTKKYLAGISVYLGPCIGPQHFEVGIDVVEAFHHHGELLMKDAFQSGLNHGKWHANLFKIATKQCQLLGIDRIFTEEICCFEEKDVFFSHRRDRQTGRFASFLWKI